MKISVELPECIYELLCEYSRQLDNSNEALAAAIITSNLTGADISTAIEDIALANMHS